MPPLTLRPVRLSDATLALGKEYTCADAAALQKGLPALYAGAHRWQAEHAREARVCLRVELAAAGAEACLGADLLVKAVRPDCPEARLQTLLAELVEALRTRLDACGLAPAEQNGVVRRFPAETGRWHELRRAFVREAGGAALPTEYFFDALDDGCALSFEKLRRAVPEGCGLLLCLLPEARPPEERELIRRAQALPAGVGSEAYRAWWAAQPVSTATGCVAALWADGEDGAERIRALLAEQGVEAIRCACPGDGLTTMYEAALDPWRLRDRLARASGDLRLGRIMRALTDDELARLCRAEAAIEAEALAESAKGPLPDPLRERLERLEAVLGSDWRSGDGELEDVRQRLSDLARRLDAQASGGEAQTAALFEQLNEIRKEMRGQRSELRQELQDQNEALRRELNDRERDQVQALAGQAERIEAEVRRGIEQIRATVDEGLQAIEARLSACVRPEETPPSVLEAIHAAGPELNVALTDEDLAILGVSDEEELLALGLTPTLLEALRFAMSLYHLGEEMDEDEVKNYIPFSFMLGYLYEGLSQLYFRPRLYAHEPAGGGAFQLADLDNLRVPRVEEYVSHALMPGKEGGLERWKEPFWIAWFNCMRGLRLLRNRVHSEKGDVTREDMRRMFSALFESSNAAKERLLRGSGPNLRVFVKSSPDEEAPADWPKWYQVGDLIKKDPRLAESAFRFLLSCREAEWRNA